MEKLTKIIERIMQRMPYVNQCHSLEIRSDEIRISWRGSRYRIGESGMVEDATEAGVLSGSNEAILLEQLLKIEPRR